MRSLKKLNAATGREYTRWWQVEHDLERYAALVASVAEWERTSGRSRVAMTKCLPWLQRRTSALGYLAAHDDAKERRLRGETQKRCRSCRRWYWLIDAGEHVDGE